jgi:hypothetical protein
MRGIERKKESDDVVRSEQYACIELTLSRSKRYSSEEGRWEASSHATLTDL